MSRLLRRINTNISHLDHPRDKLKSTTASDLTNDAPTSTRTVNRMIRILLGDPWDDYNYIMRLGKDLVATRKGAYFKLVDIRQCHSSDAVEQSRLLSRIQSPNITTVYDIYCDNDNIFIVTEHLDISFSELEIQKYELEEWEMATIFSEVQATLRFCIITYIYRF
jgi:hypothetical protein